ncbi:hypothetical protein BABINDRAFT_161053 [Babjeviella inositovora NRRL Y-12698]|uniref:Uncharacterized protein n=1 Tax=Babjeviella inositovora NRRL Y-12698 TaxID=984486 RepID=A0A1E3QT55_9ASCO|nr:uncharacterized protein BABINDRAFT_161053 [Babjeviella inositovora NRRL Y-12698]ODQ80850.1 hypothetical protein BABINDRAFT_161053 [Babjeviella inositovora NRRL Y-12698]
MAKRKAEEPQAEKPTKKASKTEQNNRLSNQYTLCIPSAVISPANAYSLEQATFIAYQIAKTCCTYDVGEIVILDVTEPEPNVASVKVTSGAEEAVIMDNGKKKIKFNFDDDFADTSKDKAAAKRAVAAASTISNESLLFATLLQYFITPTYLAKSLFTGNPTTKKLYPMLQHALKLPKISTLPFMQNNEVYKNFKEGLTIPHRRVMGKKNRSKKMAKTKYVNIGESEPLELAEGQEVPVNVRVTVDLLNKKIVSPIDAYGIPQTASVKTSFGYMVRIAKKFSDIFTECGYGEKGYDRSIYISAGDYFMNKGQGRQLAEIKEVGTGTDDAQRVLLLCGKWSDFDASFARDRASLEGVASTAQMFEGEMRVPHGVKIEDGALIALAKLHN